MREVPLGVQIDEKQKESDGNALPEIRCRRCRRLLLKGEIKWVEIKCPKCGYVQKAGARAEPPQS